MLRILEEVASRRLKLNTGNLTIQLSRFFMDKAIEEMNKIISKDRCVGNDQFELSMFNEKWTIFNRDYRDDTNDKDVEEVIYEFIKEDKIKKGINEKNKLEKSILSYDLATLPPGITITQLVYILKKYKILFYVGTSGKCPYYIYGIGNEGNIAILDISSDNKIKIMFNDIIKKIKK